MKQKYQLLRKRLKGLAVIVGLFGLVCVVIWAIPCLVLQNNNACQFVEDGLTMMFRNLGIAVPIAVAGYFVAKWILKFLPKDDDHLNHKNIDR